MKILNLGSSGQIGAYLSEYLRGKGHEVIEFDKNHHHGQDMTQIPNHNLDRDRDWETPIWPLDPR